MWKDAIWEHNFKTYFSLLLNSDPSFIIHMNNTVFAFKKWYYAFLKASDSILFHENALGIKQCMGCFFGNSVLFVLYAWNSVWYTDSKICFPSQFKLKKKKKSNWPNSHPLVFWYALHPKRNPFFFFFFPKSNRYCGNRLT